MRWTQDKLIGKTTTIDGCKVSRIDCNNGVRHYYLDNVLLPNGKVHWMAPASEKHHSLGAVRRRIKIIKDASELCEKIKTMGARARGEL